MKKWSGIVMVCLLALIAACQKKNNNTPYPQISLKAFGPDSVKSGNFQDTAFALLDFFDGDGDLTKGALVKIIDNRTNDSLIYPFPEIDPSLIDPATGVEGTCVVKIQGAVIRMRTDTLHLGKGDTVNFTLHVVDVAGHESNRVTTPNLYIRP